RMSSSTIETSAAFTAAVVTVSDSSSRGERADISGQAVAGVLEKSGFKIVAREVVPDEQESIQNILAHLSDKARLVVTTGGTGIAPRDVTPEATRSVCGHLVEGGVDRLRAEGGSESPRAALRRAV